MPDYPSAADPDLDARPRPTLVTAVQEQLFQDPQLHTYAVIDGASCPELRTKLWELEPDHDCLFSGELEPDVAEVAPYVVSVAPDTPFLEWLLAGGWGNHWGIFAAAAQDLRAMRRHFRTILVAYSPEGKQLYFRYYDPRVLRVYLPTCTKAEAQTVFGPVAHFVLENERPDRLLRYKTHQGLPVRMVVPLPPARVG